MIINQTGGGKTFKIYEDTINVTPNRTTQTVNPPEGYDGLRQVAVTGDVDLSSSNIKKGVNIFGVSGSYEGESTEILDTTTSYVGWYDPDMAALSSTYNAGGGSSTKVSAYVEFTAERTLKVSKASGKYQITLPTITSVKQSISSSRTVDTVYRYWSTRTWTVSTTSGVPYKVLMALKNDGFRGTVKLSGMLIATTGSSSELCLMYNGVPGATSAIITYTITDSAITGSLDVSATSGSVSGTNVGGSSHTLIPTRIEIN